MNQVRRHRVLRYRIIALIPWLITFVMWSLLMVHQYCDHRSTRNRHYIHPTQITSSHLDHSNTP